MVQGILREIIREGLSPSFSLAVVKNNEVVYLKAYPDFFIYDCASITKPLVTFPLSKKYLDLNVEVRNFVHVFPKRVRIKDLIRHTSGLIPWLPLYLYNKGYVETILKFGVSNSREKRYSCLNYILLANLIERKAGKDFRKVVKEFLKGYKNCFLSKLNCVNVAPTERGNLFEFNLAKRFVDKPDRKKFRLNRVIKGETHDLNSHYKNGIAGNSGLFANVFGVVELCKNLLNFDDFYLPLFEKGGYFYHLGFTGTGIAFHKERDIFVVFLSNRVCPKVSNYDFSSVRHRIFKKCFESFL